MSLLKGMCVILTRCGQILNPISGKTRPILPIPAASTYPPRSIRNVGLAVQPQYGAVGVDHGHAVEVGIIGALEEGHCEW